MASPEILDIPALLAPIPGDNPAGEPVPYEFREKFEEDRKEVDPNDFGEDDPMRPDQPKYADWSSIERTAKDLLSNKSKDLLVVVRLVEALTKRHGFAGLRDGLRLLRELCEQHWEHLHPSIEDGDLEGRAGPFVWLNDAVRGSRFPNTIRSVPVLFQKDEENDRQGPCSYQDRKPNDKGKVNVSTEDFEKAMQATRYETIQTEAEDVAAASQEMASLSEVLNKRLGPMGSAAPSLNDIREAVQECDKFMQQIRKRREPAGGAGEEIAGGATGTSSASPGAVAGSRAEVYRQLARAADVLRQLEPHSPIPYLIERAVELGNKPFPELIKALIRDANVLQELNREFGIKEEAPPPAPAG
jgi:type VI secretion system protein ImpA